MQRVIINSSRRRNVNQRVHHLLRMRYNYINLLIIFSTYTYLISLTSIIIIINIDDVTMGPTLRMAYGILLLDGSLTRSNVHCQMLTRLPRQ